MTPDQLYQLLLVLSRCSAVSGSAALQLDIRDLEESLTYQNRIPAPGRCLA
jgi:hypothetical protein